MANHDRVGDLYYGRIDRVETQNACRDRIHWLCEKVRGDRVLDIGCSQGIMSIILGREGYQVLGVDIEKECIASAEASLAVEPQIVQDRVSFKQMDAYRADFQNGSFDSVILGEVLEHLVQPEQLLARVWDWLTDGGSVVASVPLGYRPSHNHKRTFYLTQLIDLFSDRFSVIDVTVLHARHLCGVATKPPAGQPPLAPSSEMLHEWSLICDQALEKAQRRAYSYKCKLQTTEQDLRNQLVSLREEVEASRFEKLKREKAERWANRLKNQLESTQEVLDVRVNEVRYRVGDALVRATTISRDTLLLPIRLVQLLFEGLKKRRARRFAQKNKSSNSTFRVAAGKKTDIPEPKPLPDWLSDLESAPHLETSFSDVPKELIVYKDLQIAGVMDEFSWRAWQYEANLFTFTPESWKQTLESRRPHLLLVESTWHGLWDNWHFQVRDLGKRPDKISHYALPEIIEWCRSRDIPTVFYNKEDPPNFEFFIDAAKLFDFVFTSDANCIPEYREHVGHDRVFALPFAAQPRIHNPVAPHERRGDVCFAGTWYNHRHQQRQSDAEAILKPALDFNLYIFDRMAESPSTNYRWPSIYQPSVFGALSYAKMVAAYKRFKVFLNINSVSDSPTMFARRVFELLASGTPVLSSESRGIEAILGREVVLMSRDEENTRNLLAKVLGDDDYRGRLSLLGQRKVFSEHTYNQRLKTILNALGMRTQSLGKPVITVIAAVHRERDVEDIWNAFQRQSYEQTCLILCTNQRSLSAHIRKVTKNALNVRIVCHEQRTWGNILRCAVAKCESDRLAVMRPGDYYGPHYLTDYMNTALYIDHAAIGKQKFYVAENGESLEVLRDGFDYRFVQEVCPWTLCLHISQARELAEQMRDCATVFEWWNQGMRSIKKIYSSDSFNYVQCIRNDAGVNADASSDSSLDTAGEQRLAPALV